MRSLSKRVEKLEGNTSQEHWIRIVRRQMMALRIIPQVELPVTWNRNTEKLTLADVIKGIDERKEFV
jgi:hypothetical protein